MATTLTSLVSQARTHLKEATASFWSDAELVEHANNGIKDLWGMAVDLQQEHFVTEDATNVSLAASTTTLTGVPADLFRVEMIEPRDTTVTPGQVVVFEPRDFKSADFQNARSRTAQDPTSGLKIFYAVHGAGAPTGAPTIRIAPQITSALDLRVLYVPVLATKVAADNNPIPGESDQALIAWIVAYARAKEREDRSPDPNWLAIYKTEKENIRVRLTPRQNQEPEVVEDFMRGWMN